MKLSRRNVLSGLSAGPMVGAALAAGALGACAKERQPSNRVPFDPSNYRASTQAFLKLTGSLNTETVRRWFTGKVYAYRPGEATIPLFYLDGFYLENYEARADGSHLMTRYEITIKRHLQTGELLEEWDNPFTAKRNRVENSVGGPQQKIYNDWGFDKAGYPRTKDNPLDLEWMVFGDDAWVTWDLFLRFRNPLQPEQYPLKSSGEMLDLVNLTNYKGKLSDIENPDLDNAPGVMIWNGISSWSPFMRMGQMPGALIYKCIGVKLNSFSDMPGPIFDAAEKAFPGHLKELAPWREGSYAWFDENQSADIPERWVNDDDNPPQ